MKFYKATRRTGRSPYYFMVGGHLYSYYYWSLVQHHWTKGTYNSWEERIMYSGFGEYDLKEISRLEVLIACGSMPE